LTEKQTSIKVQRKKHGENRNKEEKCSSVILGEMARNLLVLTERIDPCDSLQSPRMKRSCKEKENQQGWQVQFEEFQEHGGEKLCYQLLSCRECMTE